MKLKIVTPQKSIEKNIEWLEINTSEGNFIIQEGHAPMLMVLSPDQKLTYKSNNQPTVDLDITSGIVSIDRQLTIALIHTKQTLE